MRSATEVLVAMVAMFDSGDPTGADAVVAVHYHDHQGLAGRPLRGVEGFAHVVRTTRANHIRQTVSIEDVFGVEDRAVARLRWQGVRVDGTEVDRQTIEIIRCANGRAVEHWGAEA